MSLQAIDLTNAYVYSFESPPISMMVFYEILTGHKVLAAQVLEVRTAPEELFITIGYKRACATLGAILRIKDNVKLSTGDWIMLTPNGAWFTKTNGEFTANYKHVIVNNLPTIGEAR